MEEKICCFTGHRTVDPAEREALIALLDKHLAELAEAGYTEFRTGGALGFDTLAAERVLALCEKYPACRLHLILPCRDQDKRWSARDRAVYADILSRAHRVTVLRERYSPDCMHARNRALVDGSDLCLAYLLENRGGTLYTCAYALKHGVPFYNLADSIGRAVPAADQQ